MRDLYISDYVENQLIYGASYSAIDNVAQSAVASPARHALVQSPARDTVTSEHRVQRRVKVFVP